MKFHINGIFSIPWTRRAGIHRYELIKIVSSFSCWNTWIVWRRFHPGPIWFFHVAPIRGELVKKLKKVGNSDLYNPQWLSNVIIKFIFQWKIGDKFVLTWAAGTTRKKRWYSGFKMLSVLNVSVTYCWKWMNVIRL